MSVCVADNRIGERGQKLLRDAAGDRVELYLDDQMSAWTVTDNHFTDCHVCSFIGGGRRNVVANNRFVRCGTVQYFNNQRHEARCRYGYR